MHKEGHAGMSILLSSPFVAFFVSIELYAVAFIFISLILIWSGVPDIDIYLQKYEPMGFSSYPITHWEWIPLLKLTSVTMNFSGNYIYKVPKNYQINKVTHRGLTHTLWFSIAFGFAISVLTSILIIVIMLVDVYAETNIYVTIYEILTINPIYTIPLSFIIGFLSICFHCVGDVFTPTGIHFLTPRTDYGYTFDLFYAKDEVANRSALPFGLIMISYSIFFGYFLGEINTLYLVTGFFGLLLILMIVWMIFIKTRFGEFFYAVYDFLK
jgi:membrane-bound metal-dependent hydrolase YbcI (DUF457 family)